MALSHSLIFISAPALPLFIHVFWRPLLFASSVNFLPNPHTRVVVRVPNGYSFLLCFESSSHIHCLGGTSSRPPSSGAHLCLCGGLMKERCKMPSSPPNPAADRFYRLAICCRWRKGGAANHNSDLMGLVTLLTSQPKSS